MSETKKRKVHTPEFKAKVALEALRSGKTINQIGQEFDVHPVQVGLWKKAIQEQAKVLFEGKRAAPSRWTPRVNQNACTAKLGASRWNSTGSKKSPG